MDAAVRSEATFGAASEAASEAAFSGGGVATPHEALSVVVTTTAMVAALLPPSLVALVPLPAVGWGASGVRLRRSPSQNRLQCTCASTSRCASSLLLEPPSPVAAVSPSLAARLASSLVKSCPRPPRLPIERNTN